MVVLDGVNAPITAGNFVSLVQKGFYNGMPIQVCPQIPHPLVSLGYTPATPTIIMESARHTTRPHHLDHVKSGEFQIC